MFQKILRIKHLLSSKRSRKKVYTKFRKIGNLFCMFWELFRKLANFDAEDSNGGRGLGSDPDVEQGLYF